MAISLRQYKPQIDPSAAKTGVEGSVQLAGQAAGQDELVAAELVKDLGNAAVGYLEEKKKIKDAADSADYSTRLLRLKTDLETAKGDALEQGVSYKDVYNEVYTPMLSEFRDNIQAAGYSGDILNAALTNFDYDVEGIRKSELAEVERIDLANLTTKLQEGLKDHYSLFGRGVDEVQDAIFDQRMQAFASVVGTETASLFTEQLLFQDISGQAAAIAGGNASIGEKLTVLDELETNSKEQLTPDKARESIINISALKNDLLVNYVEETDEARDTVVQGLNDGDLTVEKLDEAKKNLPKAEQELLDDVIFKRTAMAADLAKRLDLEPEESESLKIMDMVSRYASGVQYSTGKNKPLTYNEVFEMGKDLSTQGQTVFYTMMKQAMLSKQKAQAPITTYQEQNALSPVGLLLGGLTIVSPISTRHLGGVFSPYKAKEEPITFDVTGGNFVEELFYYSENINPTMLMDWLRVTTSEFENFKREHPNPTKEQYQAFQAVHFKPSIDNKIQTSLRRATGTSASEEVYVTPEEMQLIKQSKGN